MLACLDSGPALFVMQPERRGDGDRVELPFRSSASESSLLPWFQPPGAKTRKIHPKETRGSRHSTEVEKWAYRSTVTAPLWLKVERRQARAGHGTGTRKGEMMSIEAVSKPTGKRRETVAKGRGRGGVPLSSARRSPSGIRRKKGCRPLSANTR
jgi:hypothetical protein